MKQIKIDIYDLIGNPDERLYYKIYNSIDDRFDILDVSDVPVRIHIYLRDMKL